ncbi:ABC transporter permease subunit [Ramlibacter albus]|uniref:ABC transporter permease subunit n=1 Tax=Ramlibacter albus TaxID=2079448 RepID=A0A923S4T8_9BURK|nr:ABC transporter permease subunit [Ramlibacter albus]MBC5767243.1 ABC transporter permease subunit [Ramlibacter albus]
MKAETKAFLLGIIGVPLVLAAIVLSVYGAETGRVIGQLGARAPMLLTGTAAAGSYSGGFAVNIIISFWSMAIAMVAGVALGICLIAETAFVRVPAEIVMNALRNSPWLVVLYAMLYLLPFEISVFGKLVELSPTVKAIFGLALPVTANIAEVFRGGVQAIPTGQWESARSLGYRPLQILRYIVVPQAIPLMTPNLMTIYAMLFIGTSLVVVTGTADVLSVARTVIGSDGAHLATAIYLFVLLLFFLFAFPIAIASRVLERRVGAVPT